MFHCTLEQFLNIKNFKIVANEELLSPTLFPYTGKLLLEKLHPQKSFENLYN